MMKKWLIAMLVFGAALNSTADAANPEVDNAKTLRSSGEVHGTVQCAPGTGPATATLVYIAGESFLVRPNESGAFILEYVPAGTHDLVIEMAGQEVVRTPIQVGERESVEVNHTVACPQAQACAVCGDGIVAAGEQCDTGGESPSCNLNCTFTVCGDNIVNRAAGEQCEPNSDCPSGFHCAGCRCAPNP